MDKVNKILIIDDDVTTAYLHKRFLESIEVAIQVEYITDPHQALKYIHENFSNHLEPVPDLIFLDVEMPGLNGFEFVDRLEALGIPVSNLFIVMHTASLHPELRNTAENMYREKIKGFVHKPLPEGYVKEAVRKVLM